MQYFTFLGVGTLPEGYEEALYSFEDNKEEIHASKYVQSAIIEKFQSDISESAVQNNPYPAVFSGSHTHPVPPYEGTAHFHHTASCPSPEGQTSVPSGSVRNLLHGI